MAYNIPHMLKQLRNKKVMKRLLWAIVILIIPPFMFWGAGSALRSKQKGPSYAGTIFGKTISFEEYGAAWQAAKNQALLTYGSRLNQVYDDLNLEKQAWDRLILLTEAKKRRIRVTDKEVVNTIQTFSFLQSRGQFDKEAYGLILEQVFRISPRQFEEEIRDTLSILKLRDSVIKGIGVTNKEVKDAYRKENEKSKIAYILVPPDGFKNEVEIDPGAPKKYYEGNAESFRVPEQVNVQYLGFEFSDYQKDIQVSDKDIKNYYNAHKDEFNPKKEFKDSKDIIKNKLIQDTAKEKALIAAEKIDYILTDKTKIFEEAAMENSIPVKETGFFSRQGPIPQIGWFPEIQKIAFKLKPGERSELIKSDMDFINGYYIIKVKEKKNSYIPAMEEVSGKIKNILKNEGAINLAYKEANRLHRKILALIKTKNITFEEAAAKVMHQPKRTEFFTRDGYIQGLGLVSEIGEAAFNTKYGMISPVIKTRAGFCIFTALEVTSIDELAFKKERKKFTKKALEAKKMDVLNKWYTNLVEKADLKNNIISEEK